MAPPLVIPIFIPHSGCPHQCVFCNQSIITQKAVPLPGPKQISEIIRDYLGYKGNRSRVELAFFGGNFLGLPRGKIIDLLQAVQPHIHDGAIQSIRFSTRPDTITRDSLEVIAPYPISMVELGVQSMDDAVLRAAGRGHSAGDTLDAVSLLRKAGLGVGVQVMVGLPGDTKKGLMTSTRLLASLAPDVARIYPLLVLEDSPLALMYRSGDYLPLSLDHAVCLVKGMHGIFEEEGVKVIRMGLQASEMMEDHTRVLAGPWHPAFGHLVFSAIFLDRVCRLLDEKLTEKGRSGPGPRIILRVNPRDQSRLRGDKNSNLSHLVRQYPGVGFEIQTSIRVEPGGVEVVEN